MGGEYLVFLMSYVLFWWISEKICKFQLITSNFSDFLGIKSNGDYIFQLLEEFKVTGRYIFQLLRAFKVTGHCIFELLEALKVMGHYIFQLLRKLIVMRCYIFQLLEMLKIMAVSFKILRNSVPTFGIGK